MHISRLDAPTGESKLQPIVPALVAELRATLTTDEIDFLAERVNPVVRERCAWLQNGLA